MAEAPEAPPAEGGALKALVDDLHERREKAKLGGGEEKIAKQHAAGKLTARERIDLLVDEGTFVEMGMHARPHFSQRAMEGKDAPADGVITGWGEVDGRTCAIAAYDFTVMAGSMGMTGEIKMAPAARAGAAAADPADLAARLGRRADPGGGRARCSPAPAICSARRSRCPASSRWSRRCSAHARPAPPTSRASRTSSRWSSARARWRSPGPHLTKAVTGEEISMEDLGGAKVHCRKSGVGDLECKDDAECIEAVKTYLSFFPSNCEQKPPVRETADPVDRMSEQLLEIVPDSNRKPYDMYEVIAEIVDDGEYFDIKPRFAKTIITCLARFGGQPVGIVANQPKQLGGILENDSADKAARFVNLCDAFEIPLVFLQDVPGFMVGSKVEHAGIIRHGAKMLYAISRATVPKVTVVVRKAYGAGYYVMNGTRLRAGPDLRVAERRDLGDGRRGRGQHHRPLGDRSVRRPRRDP